LALRDICCGCTKAVGVGANRTSTKIYEYAPWSQPQISIKKWHVGKILLLGVWDLFFIGVAWSQLESGNASWLVGYSLMTDIVGCRRSVCFDLEVAREFMGNERSTPVSYSEPLQGFIRPVGS
jgi:hypothetical protein